MSDLVRQFFWIIFPILGMGIGALAVWSEFARQKKALEVLKVYAEKGVEPPASVLAVLNRASTPGGGTKEPNANPWARFAFFLVMMIGFGCVAAWFGQGEMRRVWVFVAGFGITAFVMAAQAASALVSGLTAKRADDR